MVELPDYARVVRNLGAGEYPYLALLPGVMASPAISRIVSPATPIGPLLDTARVRIEQGDGYIWVDDEAPAIVLIEQYYQNGSLLDLYLDLLHELTHLRQLAEGHSLWDETLPYVDRPTEIEGYAVAVAEGLRLGLTRNEILRHLSNPWMTRADVRRILRNVERFLGDGKAFTKRR